MRNRPSRPRRSDDGFTFIEVLITVSLLSIAFVGILTAVASMITSGTENKVASNVEAAVRNVAGYVQSFTTAPYVTCGADPKTAYQHDIDLDPVTAGVAAGYVATVDSVQYWNDETPASFNSATPACPVDHLQLVTVTVKSCPSRDGLGNCTGFSANGVGGQASRSLAFLKRSSA